MIRQGWFSLVAWFCLGCGTGSDPARTWVSGGGSSLDACELESRTSARLHTPGVRGRYVDAMVVEFRDPVVLILGNDGFRWPDSEGSERFAGVVWDLTSGEWEDVTFPEPRGRLEGLSAAPAVSGWNVVAGVTVDGSGFLGDSVASLWHAQVSEAGVESMKEIPRPSAELSGRHSALIHEGEPPGSLVWLIAQGRPFDARLVRLGLGRSGVWKVREPMQIEFPSYVAATGPPGDADILLVHPRRRVPGDGNSLQYYPQGDPASGPYTIASRSDGAVHRPWIGTAGGTRLISFVRQPPDGGSRDLQVGVLEADRTPTSGVQWRTVAQGVVTSIPVRIEFAGRRLWTVVSFSDGRVELLAFRFGRAEDEASLSVASWPLRGLLPPVQLRSVDDSTLMVVGGALVEDSTNLVSGAEFIRVRCRSP